MDNKWYKVYKDILIGPFLRIYNRPEVEGLDNIPRQGPAILASNHQAVMDSFYFPLVSPRQMVFPAKSEYFTAPGLKGRFQKWFFTSTGQAPLDRTAGNAMDSLLSTARSVLDKGDLFGIYPEGTRSPDGRIYRGKLGMARVAVETGVPIVPVGMIGTREANPIGTWMPRPAKVRIRIGKPIDPRAYINDLHLDAGSHEALRALTDHVMHTLSQLVGQPYVDVYAKDVKDSLAAGKGYPEGAQP
ncbi:lysophospholipid acyltransferase family protein [Corynebacterium pacaense]|uniref:lysophospholipid acyltransferase family protein n=1 Tax=Corynebacterium pacaense TaxID=1816684 RepID=UPI0009BB59CB|nr:lysophospholipid acyltransferase family protein [Corynebacterium pacaense]